MTAREFLTHLFTGKDGESFDLGRVLWAGACVQGGLLQAWDVIAHHVVFDIEKFGIGVAALLAGGAGSLALKRKTEPEPPAPSKEPQP